ncbi:MAG: hypothetical protein H0U18_12050 [Pyrinomonadaceae bacterium]|nr:hypothetical protein [Pyrinomonadaceae bacterium]
MRLTHPIFPAGTIGSQISQCVFDLNCIHARRINTGLAFFYSGEFIQTDPDMASPPGSPGFNPAVYNRDLFTGVTENTFRETLPTTQVGIGGRTF